MRREGRGPELVLVKGADSAGLLVTSSPAVVVSEVEGGGGWAGVSAQGDSPKGSMLDLLLSAFLIDAEKYCCLHTSSQLKQGSLDRNCRGLEWLKVCGIVHLMMEGLRFLRVSAGNGAWTIVTYQGTEQAATTAPPPSPKKGDRKEQRQSHILEKSKIQVPNADFYEITNHQSMPIS